jgi:hypothetical protein
MSKYRVVEAACYAIVSGVGSVLLYRDAPVPDATENLADLEADGFIVKIEDGEEAGGHPSDLPDDYVAPVFAAPGPDDVDGDGPIPAKSATKGEWVDYAVSQGATQEDAEASTKEDLIAAYGGA